MDALKFRESALNRWKFWLGMWKDLPSVAFWGIKVKDLNDTSCVVVVPFNYRSKNPFRSIYFGALSGAAELATGLLCKKLILERGNFSMLVTGFRAEFTKKATSATFFTCDQGKELAHILDNMINAGDSAVYEMKAIGKNADGADIMTAYIQWSFKRK
ncbi:MAG: DUF4442 domain-containing protein [Saprospiraceae bacterium]|nr:DUF4442 domain-containing protein [Saprospiraceae bacterium]